VVIQVNGKVRGRIAVAFGTPNDALEKTALSDAKIQTLVKDKQILKIVVVPDKLVNIVVK
jgi:leucyl-tRNA synthetase